MSDDDGNVAGVAECCADEDNLEEVSGERDDLVVRVCRVCGCRHFEVFAEPGDMRAEAP